MQMNEWKFVIIAAVVLIFVFLGSSFVQHFPDVSYIKQENDGTVVDSTNTMIRQLLIERNTFSRLLNKKQQKIGQLECQAKKDKVATSGTGGWCQEASTETGGEHKTDAILASALAEFFEGKHVASFGDGPGRYKQLVLNSGKVKGYDAYDGAPFCEDTSEGRVQFLDLTLPQYGLPMYDWVMSLEVAEHIPKQYESNFIDNVVRHAREGIILSWARLGQPGYSHVNNQPFEYVKQIMEDNGFEINESDTNFIQNAASKPWLKRNMNVYRRKNMFDVSVHDA